MTIALKGSLPWIRNISLPIVIDEPDYVYFKVIPTTSVRNYNSGKIVNAVQALDRGRIYFKDKKLVISLQPKISFYIYIEKNAVEFYFIIPRKAKEIFKTKIRDTWNDVTIQEVFSLPLFNSDATKYQVINEKEDALVLASDLRSNVLLESLLTVTETIQEGDRLGIIYTFKSTNQKLWRAEYKRILQDYRQGYPVFRDKLSWKQSGMLVLNFVVTALDIFLTSISSIMGAEEKKNKNYGLDMNRVFRRDVSEETIKKGNKKVVEAKIVVLSEGVDKKKEIDNAITVCESFKVISLDNELVYKKLRGSYDIPKIKFGGDYMKLTTDECQNLIALPGRSILDNIKTIERIDTYESEVPEELRQGVMCLGVNTYKGNKQKAYLSTDRDFQFLTYVIIGPTRAGKSTLMANLAGDAVSGNECVIVLDFIDTCQLSRTIMDHVKGLGYNVLEVSCSDFKRMEGLGYNEINTIIDDDPFIVYRNAKVQANQLMALLNSVNPAELSAKMDRYLESAALVTFINKGAIKDVFGVLSNHNIRMKFINNIPKDQKKNLEEYIATLEELNEYDKKTGEVVGTKTTSVIGILDRFHKLKQNTYMELMLKKDCSSNINLVEEMQKPQLICIKMPEIMFTTSAERDIYTTYWLTKIWLALQIRSWLIEDPAQRVKVNIMIDEIYQVPYTEDYVRSKISQMAKFGGKLILSCHYINQLRSLRDELRSANASYSLVSGCDKENYFEFKDELAPYGLEDLLNLKRYHAINLIKYSGGYAKFITELPKPLYMRKGIKAGSN